MISYRTESILELSTKIIPVLFKRGGVAKLPDRTAFAGSVATADRLVRTMVRLAQVPLQEAISMITITPARIMNMDNKKGSIVVSKDADLVIFDDDINIHATMVEGKIVYSR